MKICVFLPTEGKQNNLFTKFHTTWEEPFSPALYVEKFGSFNALLTERRTSFPDAPCGYGDVWKLAWQKSGSRYLRTDASDAVDIEQVSGKSSQPTPNLPSERERWLNVLDGISGGGGELSKFYLTAGRVLRDKMNCTVRFGNCFPSVSLLYQPCCLVQCC